MKDQEKVINEVVILLQQSKLNYEIRNFLSSKGVDSNDMDEIINEAKIIHLKKSGKKRKFIWRALTVFIFILFYFLIPNGVYNIYPVLFSILGAALFTFFLVQSFADFRSFEEFNTKNKAEQDWRHKYTPFLIIPGIVMVFVFIMNFSSNEKNELKKFGIKVKGTIVDGTSLKTRRGGAYEVFVTFKTKEGKTMTVSESVGENEFLSFHKGQEVELLYSSKDPQIIELLTNEITVKEYMGSEERELMPTDLITLLSLDEDEVDKFLNQINYGWKFDDKETLWLNERSNSVIQISSPKEVKCVTFGRSFMQFPEIFKKEGFKPVDSDEENIKLFESGEYNALIETIVEENQIGILTIITRK